MVRKSEDKSLPLAERVHAFLDENKAVDIVTIDLTNKTSFADAMVVASGTSGRFVKGLAEKLKEFFHKAGYPEVRLEGTTTCDWVLVDNPDVVVHLFRPEVRDLYQLEKMWSAEFRPQDGIV